MLPIRTASDTLQSSFPASNGIGISTLNIRQRRIWGPAPLSIPLPFLLPPPRAPVPCLPLAVPVVLAVVCFFFLTATPRSTALAVPLPHRSFSRSTSSRGGRAGRWPGGKGRVSGEGRVGSLRVRMRASQFWKTDSAGGLDSSGPDMTGGWQ